MTTDGLEIRLDDEMQAVINRAAWYLTPEQAIRNFFWLYKRDVIDENGHVRDIDDDFRNDIKVKKAGVYEYYTTHKVHLDAIGITEAHMKQFFPYVQFNQIASPTAWKTEDKSWLQTVSDDSGEPQKRKRKPSVPKS